MRRRHSVRWSKMYRSSLRFIILLLLICNYGGEIVAQTTVNEVGGVKAVVANGVNKTLKICDVCDCADDIINCTARGLTHNFADGIWPETPLKLVTFEGNSIVYVKKFPNLTIERLVLSRNRITKFDDEAFKLITNLTELDLSHNHLTSNILRPEIFTGKFSSVEWEPLEKLRVLDLGYNNLHTLKQDLFEHITDIKVLILTDNPMTVIDHSTHLALGDLINLEEFDLSNCELKELPDHIFHVPKYSLKRLYLNGNRFSTLPSALEDAKVLEYLNLNENPIEIVGNPYTFPHLPNLKDLRMRSMPNLMRIGAGTFSQLESLEYLYIDDCPKLQEIHEDAFVKHTNHGAIWPPLKILDISDNALEYLPSTLVGRWDRLEQLELINNQWSCDCENQFLIGNLLPNLGKTLMKENINKLFCVFPPEYAGRNLTSLENRKLRCPDFYGARPERDAVLLVGLMIGLLLAIPVVLTLFLFWRRGYFFCNSQNPGSFSRAFYKRTMNDEDF